MTWAHAGLLWAGSFAFILAALCSVLYLVQSGELKSKHPGTFFLKLPSLEKLDRTHFRMLTIGFVLFFFGIVSGLFWAERKRELAELWNDPRVILSFMTFLLYGVVLGFRLSALRRGQKIAAGTILIFLLLLASLLSAHTWKF